MGDTKKQRAFKDLAVERFADISDCGRYRWRLSRRWDDGPQACFVMLNPSTADGLDDDPTVRRCVRFARGWGYGELVVVNLFPYRATDPGELITAQRRGLIGSQSPLPFARAAE